jgi:hypothetical protein
VIAMLPFAAALVSAAFAGTLLRQFARSRRFHHVAWALAMGTFALASMCASLGVLIGWTDASYRAHYLLGAVINVPILAAGTVYLHLPTKPAHALAAFVLLACGLAAVAIWSTALETSVSGVAGRIPAGSEVMPDGMRRLSRWYSYSGFAAVAGGAVYSTLRLLRRPGVRFRRLAQANALIALGTAIVAAGSAFARHGAGTIFAAGLAIGVTVMFAGFLRTRTAAPTGSRPAAQPVTETAAGKAAS